jgi:hypothetical protein
MTAPISNHDDLIARRSMIIVLLLHYYARLPSCGPHV